MLVILNKYNEHPRPDRNIILDEVSRLKVAIGASLKASIQRKQVTVELREDVFKHLFGKKGVQNGGWKVLAQEEFSTSFFHGQKSRTASGFDCRLIFRDFE